VRRDEDCTFADAAYHTWGGINGAVGQTRDDLATNTNPKAGAEERNGDRDEFTWCYGSGSTGGAGTAAPRRRRATSAPGLSCAASEHERPRPARLRRSPVTNALDVQLGEQVA
jgi:hypothetical protein